MSASGGGGHGWSSGFSGSIHELLLSSLSCKQNHQQNLRKPQQPASHRNSAINHRFSKFAEPSTSSLFCSTPLYIFIFIQFTSFKGIIIIKCHYELINY